ncbi:protein WVD2-like 7 isoform X1 [Punica granatum]|uniref:Uncharacterized protein n=2 Tax=Punica granatum TaxID=22663 RepID=A0A2I0JIV9_PUNGR|nr:protein WVD2-like 7 isoform X1 [Punica granatum]PKI56199.1 hypothetical protein CRG98_023394 [Punica granatum]
MPQLSFTLGEVFSLQSSVFIFAQLETGAVCGSVEIKMGETAASGAALEVSVSFGRFENDSLSWEKWSTFSPNKYLEEVEKCATPGSVAEKKAYFEAHYRKIAARKAEQMEQEKQVQSGLCRSDADQGQGDLVRNAGDADYEVDRPAELNFDRGMEQEHFDRAMEQEMEPNEDDLITIECNSFSAEPERVQEEPRRSEDKTNYESEDENVKKEVQEREVMPPATITSAESQSQLQEDASQRQENTNIEMESNAVLQEENAQLNPPRNTQKNIKASKERDAPKIRKKPTSPLLKSPQITTPKVSKPISVSSTASTLCSSTRLRTVQSTPRSKNLNTPSTDSSKKVAPKSLHMSASPRPANSPASAPTSTRKSFIMESMGDKDIVKRAFKMFQSNVGKVDPPVDEKSPVSKQVPSRRTELSTSHSVVARKENGGARAGSAVQRGTKAAPTSFGFRSNEKPREVPQPVKKLQKKPNAKAREQTNIHLKAKEEKEAEIKTIRQGRDVKAASALASEQKSKLKSNLDKGRFQG